MKVLGRCTAHWQELMNGKYFLSWFFFRASRFMVISLYSRKLNEIREDDDPEGKKKGLFTNSGMRDRLSDRISNNTDTTEGHEL